MNDTKDKIDELKQMQKFPKYYLSQYFDELKAQVDTKYALKLDEKDKYLEIINKIESFEQAAYNNWSSKRINTYDNEIKLIEDQLIVLDLTEITKLIDEVKYNIEKITFSNKSILFIDEKSRFYFNSNSFLLIINDEYIRISCIDKDSDDKLITRKEFNDFILMEKLKKININNSNVLNLDIDILNQRKIKFEENKIREIHSNLFIGLANLEYIYFGYNKIEVIHENKFDGLSNLKKMDFFKNKIERIHPNLFNGLVNLDNINFSKNKIEVIHENTFNGLAKLRCIHFNDNQIKEINLNLFNGLAN
jgi:Leucine-rich repeat (LRR) protein